MTRIQKFQGSLLTGVIFTLTFTAFFALPANTSAAKLEESTRTSQEQESVEDKKADKEDMVDKAGARAEDDDPCGPGVWARSEAEDGAGAVIVEKDKCENPYQATIKLLETSIETDGGSVKVSNFKNIKDGELTAGQMRVVLQAVQLKLLSILEKLAERVEAGNPLHEEATTEGESALFVEEE